MSEPRLRYIDTPNYEHLQLNIAELERWIHHDIDHYEMDMSEDLLSELKDLERMCRQVNRKMKKEAVEDAKSNK